MLGHQERGRRIQRSGIKFERWTRDWWKNEVGIPEYTGSYQDFHSEKFDTPTFMWHVNVGVSEIGFYAEAVLKPNEGVQYADFVVRGCRKYPKGLRFECKRQDTPGSAYEKLDYTLANINRAKLPTIILWVGDGWPTGTIDRITALAKKSKYVLGVYEMEEFRYQHHKYLR